MIKNCVIYKYSSEFQNRRTIDQQAFPRSTLERCLQETEGFRRKRIQALAELAKNERLSLNEESKGHYVSTCACEFRSRRLVAATETPAPFVPVNFTIWLRKKTPWVISFDAGRRLSGAAIALISYATTGSPVSIEHIKLEKQDFLRLKDWLLRENHSMPGQIRRITMHDIIEENSLRFKQIVLNSARLEDSQLFKRLLNLASAISDLTFVTPPTKSTNRSLTCKITHWGCLTLYTPNLLDSEVSELIGNLENLFT